MPEDAGKKVVIRNFLQDVSSGLSFIEGIWIEREIKEPGTEGEYNTAQSLRKKPISKLTELLEDDIKNTFDDRFFTFRFIAARAGSGKSALLTYFKELITTNPNYYNNSVVVKFSFPKLFSESGSQNFGVKLYSYIIVQTLSNLLSQATHISQNVINVAKEFLKSELKDEQFALLQNSIYSKKKFSRRLTEYLAEKSANFENIFFELIEEITNINPSFTFVYLIDEFGASGDQEQYFNEARIIIRNLINTVYDTYQGKINLIIYVVGIDDEVKKFIKGDEGLRRRVLDKKIELVAFRKEECREIKEKITERIQGAYSGCSDFKEAWSKIQQIDIEPGINCDSLGDFCKLYGGEVLKIHEQYFKHFDKSFNVYENKARDLVEAECRTEWHKFLKKANYQLKVANSTTSKPFHTPEGIKTHAFDCYVELLHNSEPVARAFGEAKNYGLLPEHLTTFDQWLKDADFKPSSDKDTPHDLAFIIAPSCPPLSKRKLELKNIKYIEQPQILDSDKAIKKDNTIENPSIPTESTNTPEENSKPEKEIQPSSNDGELVNAQKPAAAIKTIKDTVNINTGTKEQLINALKGTSMKKTTIDLIIQRRQNQPFTDLDDLFSHLKSTQKVKDKFQEKLDKGEICFK